MKTYPWYKESPVELGNNMLIKGMSALQFGAFMRLRHAMWQNEQGPGTLPLIPDVLRNIAGLSLDEWESNSENILRAFSQNESKKILCCLDLLQWYEHAEGTSGERSKSGKQGGRPRKDASIPLKFSPDVVAVVNHYRDHVYCLTDGTDDSLYEACHAVTQILDKGECPVQDLYSAMSAYAEELEEKDMPIPYKAANFFKKRIYEMYKGA